MEHFRRLAFCMLYLFTFIWQLSAQVKKIPQWERFEIVLQGTAKGNPFADASLTATFWQQGGDTVNVQGFYDGDGRYVIRFMPINLFIPISSSRILFSRSTISKFRRVASLLSFMRWRAPGSVMPRSLTR